MILKIVPKVWGEERWIVNNEYYCGKILVLNKGAQCSLHFHRIKHETFHVLGGCVRMELGAEKLILMSGDTVTIAPYVAHRFFGETYSEIIEFSTTHSEEDVERITPSVAAEKSYDC